MQVDALKRWLADIATPDRLWYAKRLSGNDTAATGAHQAGPYVPRRILQGLFPTIGDRDRDNPDVFFPLHIASHPGHDRADPRIRAIWYNNKVPRSDGSARGGTRDECRLTGFGGLNSPILHPDSTGAIALFAFRFGGPGDDATEAETWICGSVEEEEAVEAVLGPIEPGALHVRAVPGSGVEQQFRDVIGLFQEETDRRSCWLNDVDIPDEWLIEFPDGATIIDKVLELRPETGAPPDTRLVRRRDCEYELFRSLEEVVELERIHRGFNTIQEFLDKANSILQRRKSRSGRSLELHARAIFEEEGLVEGVHFSYQPESEPGRRPDFLFPSECAYKEGRVKVDELRMLAVKTTCRDRWRQVLEEAGKIPIKHLLTLQEGMSEAQFNAMHDAGVRLVVPRSIVKSYPEAVRSRLCTFGEFVASLA